MRVVACEAGSADVAGREDCRGPAKEGGGLAVEASARDDCLVISGL